jgi:hypothetical protein
MLFKLLTGRLNESDLVVVHAEDDVDLSTLGAEGRK